METTTLPASRVSVTDSPATTNGNVPIVIAQVAPVKAPKSKATKAPKAKQLALVQPEVAPVLSLALLAAQPVSADTVAASLKLRKDGTTMAPSLTQFVSVIAARLQLPEKDCLATCKTLFPKVAAAYTAQCGHDAPNEHLTRVGKVQEKLTRHGLVTRQSRTFEADMTLERQEQRALDRLASLRAQIAERKALSAPIK